MSATDVVKEIYELYAKGDIEGALGYCADDFCYDWRADPRHAPFGGKCAGVDAFRGKLGELHQMFDYQSFKAISMFGEGERVAAQVEMELIHRRSGERIAMGAAHFWTVRDGKATELVEYYDTALIAAVEKGSVRSAA